MIWRALTRIASGGRARIICRGAQREDCATGVAALLPSCQDAATQVLKRRDQCGKIILHRQPPNRGLQRANGAGGLRIASPRVVEPNQIAA